MSSYQCFDCMHQVRNSCSDPTRHGHSKAQMCFFKILHIISSIPPCDNSTREAYLSRRDDPPGSSRTGGVAIDLNLQFCSVVENGEFQCFASDSAAIEGNRGEEKGEADGQESVQVSEVDDGGVDDEETKFEEENQGEDGKGKESCNGGGVEAVSSESDEENKYNCLDLLLEAAKLISGSSESKSESEETRRREGEKKGKEGWMVVDLYNDLEETSPVVRTKRGRSQALPYRFRDSVMEPLKRTGRPPRPSTTTASRKRLTGS